MDKNKRKNTKNFRISDDGEALLIALSKRLGVTQVSIIEMSIRKMAASEGVTIPATEGEK
jgi:hypothetical protein